MPPGSAKTTYASILFPAWWFSQHPSSSVILTSHTADLAKYFGKQGRDVAREYSWQLGYGLKSRMGAAGHWQTLDKSEFFAAGVRGPLTGHRADLAIIDDPVKSQADADSPRLREQLWSWFRADLTTRLKPNGRIVLIMTRWHPDDLAGRLLAQDPDEWSVLRLPAVAEDNDPLGRIPDAALWPDWENDAALLRKRNTMGQRAWSALFQQSPRLIEGSLFKTDCIDIFDEAPARFNGQVVRAWDLASTTTSGGNDPDWTVGVKLARADTGRFIILDVKRLRGSPRTVEDAIAETARVDGKLVSIGLPEDPGQAGKVQVVWITSRLAGYRVKSSRESGAKTTRAAPMASQVEAHNVAMVRANWNYAFIEELRDFPFGRKDDQVDALSHAFRMLTDGLSKPTRQLSVDYLTR
jgi:predicted phage terminase large subunit-like protein